jgi:MFS family permease
MSEAKIGMAMMIPYIVMAILTLIAGCLSDFLYRRFEWSIGSVRKLMNTVGFTLVSLSLFAVGFAQQAWLATVLLSFAIGFLAVAMAGFAVNHLDVAPQYAGILMGMSNGLGTVSGVVSPILASKLTVDHSRQSWQVFFTISAALEMFCSIFYFFFGSGEVQPWAKVSHDEDEKSTLKDPEKNHVEASAPTDSGEKDVRSRKPSES